MFYIYMFIDTYVNGDIYKQYTKDEKIVNMLKS